MDNAGLMRHIILVLIALIALVGLMPGGMSKDPAPFDNGEINDAGDESLLTTPSIAAFLNDSWAPTPFVAPLASAPLYAKKSFSNNTTNSTYAILDFLQNDTNNATNTSLATYMIEGGNIYQFLKDDWNPSTPVEVITGTPYTQGKMS